MISTEPVEIIGITETWVDTAGRDFEGEYRLHGYSLFHQDRAGRAGVGQHPEGATKAPSGC